MPAPTRKKPPITKPVAQVSTPQPTRPSTPSSPSGAQAQIFRPPSPSGGGPGPVPGKPTPVPTNPIAMPPILEISTLTGAPWSNPKYQPTNWAADVCNGGTFESTGPTTKLEWVSVLNPSEEQDDEVGVSGLVVNPHLSLNDIPFFHPFGNDWECSIAPDAPYLDLCGPANSDYSPGGRFEDDARYSQIAQPPVPTPSAFLPVEFDEFFVGGIGSIWQPLQGDRIAVYGRWILDAGHADFHTEIHPPLLMGFARTVDASEQPASPGPKASTLFRILSRPYQISQLYPASNDPSFQPDFNNPSDWRDLKSYLTDPSTYTTTQDVRAGCTPFPMPFVGTHIVAFTVKAPGAPPSASSVLNASFHFTVRDGCSVLVLPSPADPTAVIVVVTLNASAYAAPPALVSDGGRTFMISDLLNQFSGYDSLDFFTQVLVAVVELAKETIWVDEYVVSSPSSPVDSTNVVSSTPITSLKGLNGTAVDDSQPFPIYGWLKLSWA